LITTKVNLCPHCKNSINNSDMENLWYLICKDWALYKLCSVLRYSNIDFMIYAEILEMKGLIVSLDTKDYLLVKPLGQVERNGKIIFCINPRQHL
jgi:hypothetical protein